MLPTRPREPSLGSISRPAISSRATSRWIILSLAQPGGRSTELPASESASLTPPPTVWWLHHDSSSRAPMSPALVVYAGTACGPSENRLARSCVSLQRRATRACRSCESCPAPAEPRMTTPASLSRCTTFFISRHAAERPAARAGSPACCSAVACCSLYSSSRWAAPLLLHRSVAERTCERRCCCCISCCLAMARQLRLSRSSSPWARAAAMLLRRVHSSSEASSSSLASAVLKVAEKEGGRDGVLPPVVEAEPPPPPDSEGSGRESCASLPPLRWSLEASMLRILRSSYDTICSSALALARSSPALSLAGKR
mmetsp:Transcript_13890/g.39326  ORF Transcript_13890/g.39326 Transcript_13890/m.39326 type:complete len:313 (-) Transcript_13890:548-1486(-)